ncbi:MAG: glyoxylase-like metal-dependent hydrolase (beta-lactamase superfamily II) [Planctomycetota bacterium]|jgi:glyoxylase-like metal-dependent hydrolase (beta-lactamase superfamily II)
MDFGLIGEITRRLIELPGNITCIDTGYIRPQLAACYLIEEDGVAGIIETGTGKALSTILAVLKLKEIPVENVRYVMPTHVHLDHAGGAGHLMQQFPNAQLVIHPRGVRHMIDPSKLWQGTVAVYGEQATERLYGELVPIDESRILIANDEFVLDFNGRPLLFLDTPGHARHHYSIYDERSSGFFTGDTFGMAYEALASNGLPYIMPTTSPVQFDPDAWYRTLQRYLTYRPERMFLTHYGMVEQVEKLTENLRRRIEVYVEIAQTSLNSNNRSEVIKTRIAEATFAELRKLNCPMPMAACKGMLKMDFDINVQGLEVWLDNQNSV